MSSLSAQTCSNARPRVNATFFQLLAARTPGTTSPENALPWRKHAGQTYLTQLSATKAATAQKIIDYISYRYRLGEYTAQFTYQEIATHLHISTKTIQRYIHELIQRRLLALVRRGKSAAFSETQANEAPIYTLLIPVDMRKNVHPLITFKKSVKSLKDSKKKFPLPSVIESASDRWATTVRLKEEVLDLRKIPTRLLAGHLKKTFTAGWCLRDIIRALEQDPEGNVYQTRGAGGMRSPLAWLHIRLNAWKTEEGTLVASPTAVARVEVAEERQRLIEQQKQVLKERNTPRPKPVRGLAAVRQMREYLKVKSRYGAVEAALRYPEQAQMLEN